MCSTVSAAAKIIAVMDVQSVTTAQTANVNDVCLDRVITSVASWLP